MNRLQIKRELYSLRISLLLAVLAFPIFLLVAGFVSWIMLIILVDSGFEFWGISDKASIGIAAALDVILAYVAARAVYQKLRWQRIESDEVSI